MKKLLIISLSAGAGHVRVAEAIRKTAELYFPQIEAQHVDLADYVSLVMKKIIADSYTMMAKKLPALFGFLYDKTNDPSISHSFNQITREIKKLSSHRLYQLIKEQQPDQIICTHFLPAEILLSAPKHYYADIPPVSTVITDFDLHNFWLVPNTENFFVANKKIAWKMSHNNIADKHITISGIPVSPVYSENKPIADLRSKYNLLTNRKTILILSGGQGLIDIGKTIEVLFQSKQPLNIIAIAGKNVKLEKKLRKISAPTNFQLLTVGWTDAIDEYMRLADIIVTKPGGSTVAECLVLKKPIIIIDPIPGQEECNTDYILSNGFGQIARSPEDLLYYIENWHPKISNDTSQEPAAKIILKKIFN